MILSIINPSDCPVKQDGKLFLFAIDGQPSPGVLVTHASDLTAYENDELRVHGVPRYYIEGTISDNVITSDGVVKRLANNVLKNLDAYKNSYLQ